MSEQIIVMADREADLLAHPYIGIEHLDLARLRAEGRMAERDALLAKIAAGVQSRWWRPRGPRSALRRCGLAETETRRAAAECTERDGVDTSENGDAA